MADFSTIGLGRVMAKKLHAVGIHTAEELKNIGSKQAAVMLRAQYPSTCVVILYHLEAAICGVPMKELTAAQKAELKAFFKQIG